MTEEKYDSTADTQSHITEVVNNIVQFQGELSSRALRHDQSKFQEPEKSAFDALTPKLKTLTYGSEEYRACLKEMKPAIDHHYSKNSHHPEFYRDGIAGMSLLDIVEMFCDWYAATKRMKDGSLEASIKHNIGRFKIDPQLAAILENTRKDLGWK